MARIYPYAILRRFDAADQRQRPYSCHLTAAAALAAAAKHSHDEQRSHGSPDAYIAVHWRSTATASECWPACEPIED